MKQKKWTLADCETLLKAVEKCKNNNRIDWAVVTIFLPGRTPVQCKSQYTAKLHYKSMDKVNMKWDLDANLLLCANIEVFGQNWKLLSEELYFNKVTSQALKKQFILISQHIIKNCEQFVDYLISSQFICLDEKSFSFYMFCIGLRYRLQKELNQYTPMPRIYDIMPNYKSEMSAANSNQLIYQPFYQKLENTFKIHEVIPLIEKMIQLSPYATTIYLCQQFDKQRKTVHKLFL
ncbi:Myb-like_DNA-binding domain-containing protein [Hexamita inflata]|uniref:Myb-like DNA-binding domain-containing protein n=1 Tax=Hexamita inflata TaxID=28002 RepID=A0AA86QC94_9EUKA|nr:Myb-like DNA-binding domain-containing protein [Hexamita inflata]